MEQNNVDAQVVMDNETTIAELKNMEPVNRTSEILKISVLETLKPEEEGIDNSEE